jgi:hypothetical protein
VAGSVWVFSHSSVVAGASVHDAAMRTIDTSLCVHASRPENNKLAANDVVAAT